MTEEQFDELLNEMRDESVSPEQAAAAQDRVWHQIASATPMACAEFRPDLGPSLTGALTESRRLLLDDHLGRCADCRRALAELRGERRVVTMPEGRRFHWSGWTRWAVAAGIVVTMLYLGREQMDSALAPSGPRATVVSVAGALYRLPGSARLECASLVRHGCARLECASR